MALRNYPEMVGGLAATLLPIFQEEKVEVAMVVAVVPDGLPQMAIGVEALVPRESPSSAMHAHKSNGIKSRG